jgi:hypothetical protein
MLEIKGDHGMISHLKVAVLAIAVAPFAIEPVKAHDISGDALLFSSYNGFQNEFGPEVRFSAIHWGARNIIFGPSAFAVIGGGVSNVVRGVSPTVSGGYSNWANADFATVGGGWDNWARWPFSTVGGGRNNAALGTNSTVSGGIRNTARGYNASVAGGNNNTASGRFSSAGGGLNNLASGLYATVPGGTRARATHTGSFVWGADPNENTSSFASYSFTVRSEGGARFYTANGTRVGVQLRPRATAWTSLSDRDSKEHFEEINEREILEQLASMPMKSWSYKHDPGRRYIGPTAQDFVQTFQLGDSQGINTLDADGVMFAAIKGLIKELEDRDKRIAELEHAAVEAQVLFERVSSLEAVLSRIIDPPQSRH